MQTWRLNANKKQFICWDTQPDWMASQLTVHSVLQSRYILWVNISFSHFQKLLSNSCRPISVVWDIYLATERKHIVYKNIRENSVNFSLYYNQIKAWVSTAGGIRSLSYHWIHRQNVCSDITLRFFLIFCEKK